MTTAQYEELLYTIVQGDRLVIDSGSNQETVTVQNVDRAAKVLSLNAPLAKRHEIGTSVTNVGTATIMGHPGPQGRLDPRNPLFQGIVRYFSIIE